MRPLLAAVALAAAAPLGSLQQQQQQAATPAPPFQQVSQRFDYKPVQQIQAIQFGVEKVQVRQIVFAPASAAGGGKQRHSVPEAVLSLENGATSAISAGVAIAILDADGNLLAAGSGGTRPGWLAPGEREAVAIRLPYVYRSLEKARSFQLTMEILPKPSKADAAASSSN